MPEAHDGATLERRRLEADSHELSRATNAAIQRQANAWGIRHDQARSLLLDRRAIA